MNKMLLVVILLLSSPVYAQQAVQVDYCESLSGLASYVMFARQSGVAMPVMLKSAENSAKAYGAADEQLEIVKQVVVSAYEEHRYVTDRVIGRVVTEYGNQWYMECYKSTKGE